MRRPFVAVKGLLLCAAALTLMGCSQIFQSEDETAAQMYEFGYRLQNGIDCEPNPEEAVKWYRKAAERGDEWGQYSLCECLFCGEGCEKDPWESVKWGLKSAKQGNQFAQFAMGHCLENGIGCKRNLKEAVKWYRKSAKQGNEDAEAALQRLEQE